MLRIAGGSDAEALLSIYAAYIDTPITFEYDLPGAAEFRARIESVSGAYPYLVHETGGNIDGYAYAHRYRERTAYQWAAELSVYTAPDRRGKGVGRRLYSALMELLSLQGIRTVYGVVTQPNGPSDSFHEALGFTAAGTVRRAGFKAGAWHDVTTYEKAVGDFRQAPAPLRPFPELDPEDVAAVLARYA